MPRAIATTPVLDTSDKPSGFIKSIKASIFLEVEGAGHYLPTYAGNLDIMTSAAMGTAQELVKLNL